MEKAMKILESSIKKIDKSSLITYEDFLHKASQDPILMFRNVFQLFNNMIYYYIDENDEYKDDPENISYKTINTSRLLVENTNVPFFADLPLANRLIRLADSFKDGAQQNKLFVFIGPPGSGKSTFINNLLHKFEEYTNKPEGINYEILWRLDNKKIGHGFSEEIISALNDYYSKNKKNKTGDKQKDYFEVPCPGHDHPILLIPKECRYDVLEHLLKDEVKTKIFNKKEYDWIFKNEPCTVCLSLYDALSQRLNSPSEIFEMVYAKKYSYNRRLGNGITIFNPGDQEPKNSVYTNEEIQKELGNRFQDSNLIKYVFSRYAKTNNGVFTLMDVKGNNENRFLNLHGIISEGIYKLDDVEENISSLFIAVMNPEDKEKIEDIESYKDRMREIKVNYILNFTEEVKIYYQSFGSQIQSKFLPGVLENFAKIIISTRLNLYSEAVKKWIADPSVYSEYCDDNLLLLKMDIYSNRIPKWLSDQDLKNFDKKMRRTLIAESENEGQVGFSGRESINIFNDFYNTIRKSSKYKEEDNIDILITMEDVKNFFNKNDGFNELIPSGFVNSIVRLYNYNVMQEIKESLFHKNEERISNDIQNYLFASNYEFGEKYVSPYTGETVEITEQFFRSIELHLIEKSSSDGDRKKFREKAAKQFAVELQNMEVKGLKIFDTEIYKELYNTYIKNLRENIFQPFLQYTSFENAIKEYGTSKFEVYDKKTKEDVSFLLNNLIAKFKYTINGAKKVCLYVINNKVAEKFSD